jgi:DNA-binding GntR family transcriptional regulator
MKSLRAYEILRDMILRGEKLPGTRLILHDLEKELNIGRGPVREALMRLERTNLVKNIPYKGAIVGTPPTQKEILSIYEIRINLEVKLAAEALPNITDKDIARLEELHAVMQQMPDNYYQVDACFHFCIYEAANLPHLCNIVRLLRSAVESVQNIYRREKQHCVKFNNEHGVILKALKDQDLEGLTTNMAINIESGLEIIKQTYATVVNIPR